MEQLEDNDNSVLHHFLFDASLKLSGAVSGINEEASGNLGTPIEEREIQNAEKCDSKVANNVNVERIDVDLDKFTETNSQKAENDNKGEIVSNGGTVASVPPVKFIVVDRSLFTEAFATLPQVHNPIVYNVSQLPAVQHSIITSQLCETPEDEKTKRVRLKRANVKRRQKSDASSTDSDASNDSCRGCIIKCPLCPKKFKFKRNLPMHLKYKHPGHEKAEADDRNCEGVDSYSLLLPDLQYHGQIMGHSVGVEEKNSCEASSSSLGRLPRSEDYKGDDQILQRYLYDTKVKNSGESMKAAGDRPSLCKKEGVGVHPKKIGVKYEDCEFNSSDSFASTESIIEKKIVCPLCPKRFMFNSDLLRHHKRKHPAIMYRCPVCKKMFTTPDIVAEHGKRIHNKKLQPHKIYGEKMHYKRRN